MAAGRARDVRILGNEMRREHGTGAVDEQSIGGLGRSRDDAVKSGRNLLQKGVRHSLARGPTPLSTDRYQNQPRSLRPSPKGRGKCRGIRAGKRSRSPFRRSPQAECLQFRVEPPPLAGQSPPPSNGQVYGLQERSNSMTRAGNARKNNRIQAPMLDPHVRPSRGSREAGFS